MNKQYFETMTDVGRRSYEFGQQLTDINLKAFDRLTSAQVKLWGDAMEKGLDKAKRLSEAKGYRDVLEVQMELAREMTQTAVEQGRTSMEVLTGTRDELMKAYEAGFREVAEEVQKSAPRKSAA